MFGKNPIRSATYDSSQLAVESMFYTIQGEGPQAGRPALFIRLAGCNLACHFCDTEFETQAERLRDTVDIVDEITQRFPKEQRKLVVLTGGEPLRQNPVELIQWLLMTGTELVQVETAGTLWQPSLDVYAYAEQVQLVCSPKTPKINPSVVRFCEHYKYVVKARELDPRDGLPNHGTQPGNKEKEQRLYRAADEGLGMRPANVTIWVSPCDEYDPVLNKLNQDAARDACLTHGYRLSLQMHKIIGVE